MARKLKKLTVARLRAWLEAQPAGRMFKARETKLCPIAEFIDEDHLVFADHIRMHGRGKEDEYRILSPDDPDRRELPGWAKKFITAVDSVGYPYDVSRETALDYLSEVLRRRPAK